MTNTQMADAFNAAGYQTPADRLRSIGLKIIGQHGSNTFVARTTLLSAAQRDVTLLNELAKNSLMMMVTNYLNDLQRDIDRAREKELNARHRELQIGHNSKASDQPVTHARDEVPRVLAAIPVVPKEEPEVVAARLKQQQIEKIDQEWQSTKGRSYTIDGTSFWNVSPGRANQWQRARHSEWKFIQLVLAGLPTEDFEHPISYYRRPHEINDLWERAHAT